MPRLLVAVIVAVLVVGAPHAVAAVRIVLPFDPADRTDDGAIGLVVPGAGPTVTRASALDTLLTGEVESSTSVARRPASRGSASARARHPTCSSSCRRRVGATTTATRSHSSATVFLAVS